MAGVKRKPGPASERVRANLKRLRRQRGMSAAELARRMTGSGQPMLDTAVVKTEGGTRSVDVDDLVALAAVLDVAPTTLLMPEAGMAMPFGTEIDLTPGHPIPLRAAWAWACGEQPLAGPGEPRDVASYIISSKPHHFTADLGPLDKAQSALNLQAHMAAAIRDALRAGVDVTNIRGAFETSLAGLLNSMTGWAGGQD